VAAQVERNKVTESSGKGRAPLPTSTAPTDLLALAFCPGQLPVPGLTSALTPSLPEAILPPSLFSPSLLFPPSSFPCPEAMA
jgi:hypothetical protein